MVAVEESGTPGVAFPMLRSYKAIFVFPRHICHPILTFSSLKFQQQFSHKRAESFDFCKSSTKAAPQGQSVDAHRAKTVAATGIKSNCNVLPNPAGMSPVLRKNIVMASQFRSKFNFRHLIGGMEI